MAPDNGDERLSCDSDEATCTYHDDQNNSDTSSLFGDSLMPPSHFIEEGHLSAHSREQDHQCEVTIPAPDPRELTIPPAPQTLAWPTWPQVVEAGVPRLPIVPAPPGDYFLNQVGHTADNTVVSTQSFSFAQSTPAVYYDEGGVYGDGFQEGYHQVADYGEPQAARHDEPQAAYHEEAGDSLLLAQLQAGYLAEFGVAFSPYALTGGDGSPEQRDNSRPETTNPNTTHNTAIGTGQFDLINAAVTTIDNSIDNTAVDTEQDDLNSVGETTTDNRIHNATIGIEHDDLSNDDEHTTNDIDNSAVDTENSDLSAEHETATNAIHDAAVGDEQDDLISAAEIPGEKYFNTQVASSRKEDTVPRRIDGAEEKATALTPYISVGERDCKIGMLYRELELSERRGKKLGDAIRTKLKLATWEPLVKDRQLRKNHAASKEQMVKLAFSILKTDGLGDEFFGKNPNNAQRTKFWPDDSTIILSYVVRLIYKVVYTAHQSHNRDNRARLAKAAAQADETLAPEATSPGALAAAPNDAVTSPQATPASQVAPPSAVVATPRGVTTPEAMTTLPGVVAMPAGVAHAQAVATLCGVVATSSDPQYCGARPVPCDLLVEQAIRKKRARPAAPPTNDPLDVEVPEDARLTYSVQIVDKDHDEVLSAEEYRHSENRGLFMKLKSSLQEGGLDPYIEIVLPMGSQAVDTEEEWDNLVHTIYHRRRSGGRVFVNVFV